MIQSHFSRAKLVALAVATIAGGLHIGDAEAFRGGGGRGGGGMRGGGARTSISRPSGGFSRPSGGYNRPSRRYRRGNGYWTYVAVNRNVNPHVHVVGGRRFFRRGNFYRGAPVARAAAWGAAAGVTAAAIGSTYYALP